MNNPIISQQPLAGLEPFEGFKNVQQQSDLDSMRSVQLDIVNDGSQLCRCVGEYKVEMGLNPPTNDNESTQLEGTGLDDQQRLWQGMESRGNSSWEFYINDAEGQTAFSACLRRKKLNKCMETEEIEIFDGRRNAIGYLAAVYRSESGCSCKTFNEYEIRNTNEQALFTFKMQYKQFVGTKIGIKVIRNSDETEVMTAIRKYESNGCLTSTIRLTAEIADEQLPITAISDGEKRLIIVGLVWMARKATESESSG